MQPEPARCVPSPAGGRVGSGGRGERPGCIQGRKPGGAGGAGGAAAPCQPGLHRHLVPAALPARAGPSPPASARCVCRWPPPGRARAGPPSPAAVGAPRSPGLRGSGPGPPWALKGTAAARPGFDVAAPGRRTGLAQGKGWGGWRGRPGCPASPRAWGRGRHLPSALPRPCRAAVRPTSCAPTSVLSAQRAPGPFGWAGAQQSGASSRPEVQG